MKGSGPGELADQQKRQHDEDDRVHRVTGLAELTVVHEVGRHEAAQADEGEHELLLPVPG